MSNIWSHLKEAVQSEPGQLCQSVSASFNYSKGRNTRYWNQQSEFLLMPLFFFSNSDDWGWVWKKKKVVQHSLVINSGEVTDYDVYGGGVRGLVLACALEIPSLLKVEKQTHAHLFLHYLLGFPTHICHVHIILPTLPAKKLNSVCRGDFSQVTELHEAKPRFQCRMFPRKVRQYYESI